MTTLLTPLLAAILAFIAGLAASRFRGRPPLPPGEASDVVDAIKVHLDAQYDRFVDRTTVVVGGLHEEVNNVKEAFDGLRAEFGQLSQTVASVEHRTGMLSGELTRFSVLFERFSTWRPGDDLEYPTQFVRFMNESARDRADMRARLERFQRWGLRILIAAMVVVFVFGALLFFVAARVFYNWFLVGGG
jgi:hypothetical protein